jgi:Kef-type K+ transport system membrane component KefB
LVLILSIAALSPLISDVARKWTRLPGVVVEIFLGIIIGPHVLGWVHLDEVIDVLSEMGLVLLIFLAGFEIDPEAVRGRPVKLAVSGWVMSLGLGTSVAVILHALDITSGIRFVAIALTTTAIGTLLPILGDAGILPTTLGRNFMASGAMGELGPIIAISVALATDDPAKTTIVLIAFGAIALLTGWLATRPARPRLVELIARTLHSSGQFGVRVSVLLCVLLVWAAESFGLDVLLGAFAAGMVARLFLVGHSAPEAGAEPGHGEPDHSEPDHREAVQLRLEALGFGFFIPLFFVVSGVHFDLGALGHLGALAKVPMFLALFLLVRGLPAVLYRRDLSPRDTIALGLLQASALPLVVVITSLGTSTGRMRPDNAAAMVGAGLLSVVVPLIAMAVRAGDAGGVASRRDGQHPPPHPPARRGTARHGRVHPARVRRQRAGVHVRRARSPLQPTRRRAARPRPAPRRPVGHRAAQLGAVRHQLVRRVEARRGARAGALGRARLGTRAVARGGGAEAVPRPRRPRVDRCHRRAGRADAGGCHLAAHERHLQ